MIEKIQYSQHIKQNNFFLPQILSIQAQRQILKCPNHNPANSVCISSQCSIPGLMCLDVKCQCRRVHYRCHHILLDRVLESVQKHQKQIPQKVKEIYKTIYDVINDMIEKLSKLRNKFQRQQQYFGLRQQELQLMELINDGKIDQVNGKIINSLEKTFDTEIQLNKNTKEDIIKDFQQKSQQFDKLCKYIEESYLQTKISTQLKNKKLFENSKIIENDQEKEILNYWLKQAFDTKNIKSQLLFRASQNNFEVKQFHKACDQKKNTLTIVRNQFGKKIGGFAKPAWHSTKNQYITDQTGQSFLFSLNLKEIYNCLNLSKSIYCNKNKGPSFGNGSDLKISDKCNENQSSYGQLGSAYNIQINNNLMYQCNQNTYTQFTGNTNGSNFKVLQYQIYQISQS